MAIAENIDALLVKFDINQEALARIADVAPSAISRWRQGATPRKNAVENICAYFHISEDDLMSSSYGLAAKEHGRFPDIPGARMARGVPTVRVPLLGRVHAGPAGEPDVYEEAPEGVEVEEFYFERDPEVHVLDYEGDCMDKVFGEGTTSLVVSPNAPFGNGDIVVAVIDGTEYVVRKLEQTARELRLRPCSWNPEHEDIVVSRDEERQVEFKGKVLKCFKRFE